MAPAGPSRARACGCSAGSVLVGRRHEQGLRALSFAFCSAPQRSSASVPPKAPGETLALGSRLLESPSPASVSSSRGRPPSGCAPFLLPGGRESRLEGCNAWLTLPTALAPTPVGVGCSAQWSLSGARQGEVSR